MSIFYSTLCNTITASYLSSHVESTVCDSAYVPSVTFCIVRSVLLRLLLLLTPSNVTILKGDNTTGSL